MDYKGVFFRPLLVRNSKKNIKVSGELKLNLSRFSRHTKIVSPNADLLAAFPFLGARLIESNSIYYSFDVSQPKLFGAVPSLAGILRALVILKYRYPQVYRMIFKLARYLSYEFDEETLKVPPFHLLTGYSHSVIDLAWKVVEAETGVSKELYAYIVSLELEKERIENRGRLIDEVSLFAPAPEEDRERIEQHKASMQVPDWFMSAVEEVRREEVVLESLNRVANVKYDREELREFLRETLRELRETVSAIREEESEKQG